MSDYGKDAVRVHSEDEYRVQAALYVLATIHACESRTSDYARFGGVLYSTCAASTSWERGCTLSSNVARGARREAQIREGDAIEGYPLPMRRGGRA